MVRFVPPPRRAHPLLLLLGLLLLHALLAGAPAHANGTCTGFTGDEPYPVADATDLAAIGDCLGGTFVQTADVDLSGVDWTPIGGSGTPFTGTYDGQGHEIANLTIDGGATAGLFGVVGGGAEIRGIRLTALHLDAPNATAVGGVIATATGAVTVTDVRVTGANPSGPSAIAESFVGGVVGHAQSHLVVSDVEAHLDVEATDAPSGTSNGAGGVVGRVDGRLWAQSVRHVGTVSSAGQNVGGLVGRTATTQTQPAYFIDAHHDGDVAGHSFVGGMVGYGLRTVSMSDVSARADVVARAADGSLEWNVGGLVGSLISNGRFDVSVAEVDVTVTGENRVGGLVGVVEGNVSLAQVRVDLTSVSGNNLVGGLVAYTPHDLDVRATYVTGPVSGALFTGGIAGQVDGNATWSDVSFSGDVDGTSQVGGLVGYAGGSFSASDVRRVGTTEATGGRAAGWVATTDGDVTVRGGVHRGDVTATGPNVGGLFGIVSGSLTAEGTRIEGTTIDANATAVGGVVGTVEAAAHFTKLNADVTVRANGGNVGGLVGSASSATTGQDVTLNAVVDGSNFVGGVIGYATERASLQRLDGDVVVAGGSYVGGAFGYARGGTSTTDVHVRGTVHGTKRVGGIVGLLQSVGTDGTTLARTTWQGDVRGANHVGGLVGLAEGALTGVRTSASGDVGRADGSSKRVGGLVGTVDDEVVSFSDAFFDGATSGTENVGGLVGDLRSDGTLTMARTYASATVGGTTTTGALIGNAAGTWNGAAVAWDRDLGGTDAAGTSAALAGAQGVTTAALRDVATFDALGWSIAPGWAADTAADDVPWGACPAVLEGAPFLRFAYDADPCRGPVDAVQVTPADPAQLRNVPFDVDVRAAASGGWPTDLPAGTVLTLTAEGGAVEGVLRRAGAAEEDDPAPSVTLDAATDRVTFEDVLYTGLSAEAGGDVTLRVRAELPGGETFEGAADPISVRDLAMRLDVGRPSLAADGVDATPVVVALADEEGDAVAGVEIHLTTTLGTFTLDGGRDLGADVRRTTDANGEVRVSLRAATEAGTAELVARCPGACPVRASVAMIGDVAEVLAIPGDGVAWLLVSPIAADVAEIVYRQDAGEWTSFAGPSALGEGGPRRIDGLENGVRYTFSVRGRTPSGSDLPASDPVAVTPGPVDAPPLAMTSPTLGEVTATRTADGALRLTIPVTVRNDGGDVLPHVWWRLATPEGLGPTSVGAGDGRVARYGDAWLWRDANLAPDAEVTLEIVLEGTPPTPAP